MQESDTRRGFRFDWLLLSVLFVLGVANSLNGIAWGLPSKSRVALLGEDRASIRQQIQPDRRTESLIYVTEHEAGPPDLARAYRRYFLYSNHPDEMLTLMGLAKMRPSKLDFHPHQFQYGGLFTYPIAAILFVAGKLGLVQVTPDLSVYLEDPDAFGRLYVVGRLFVTAFVIATGLLVYHLARRLANPESAFTGAVLFLFSPAVVVFSHELKPHAAAPFFVLLAFYCAFRLLQENKQRWLWLAVLACGGATAMVYSNELFVLVALCCVWSIDGIPLRERVQRTILCLALLAGVYFLFNPYVLLDFKTLLEEVRLIRLRYEPGFHPAAIAGFIQHIVLGSFGAPTILLALLGSLVLVRARQIWSLIVLGILSLYCLLLIYQLGNQADSQKMARLLCAPFPLVAVMAAVGLQAIPRRKVRLAVAVIAMAWMVWCSWPCWLGLRLDSGTESTSLQAGRWINEHVPAGAVIRVPTSPAPYKLPPFAFAKFQLVTDPAIHADYLVTVGDVPGDISYPLARKFAGSARATPMSFANQPVYVSQRGAD